MLKFFLKKKYIHTLGVFVLFSNLRHAGDIQNQKAKKGKEKKKDLPETKPQVPNILRLRKIIGRI